MLEERYRSESWIRVNTDGSATNTTTKGGAGIYIQYPNGEQQSICQLVHYHELHNEKGSTVAKGFDGV
jgi:ribonuclease HI